MKRFGKVAKALCVLTAISMTVTGCATGLKKTDNKVTTTSVAEDSAATITLADNKISVSGSGVKVEDNIATITRGGEYTVTGSISDGQIVVDAENDVNLIMENADITYDAGDAIYIKNGDVTITLAEDSENSVTSGNESSEKLEDSDEEESENEESENEESGEEDSESDEEKEQKESMSAAIFSKDDLVIEGSGSLNVASYYYNGIQSKDTVMINSGEITVTAVNDGIKGKEGVAVSGSTLNITAEADGIQSDMDMDISGGDITIVTGGGSQNAATTTPQMSGYGKEIETNENGRPDMSTMTPPDGKEMETNEDGSPDMGGMKENDAFSSEESSDEDDGTSQKGIKAEGIISVSGGTINVDSIEDAIHSNDQIGIDGGEFIINAGDDAIHADNSLIINGGNINIERCVEGLEAVSVEINDGEIDITASDDGINANGGNSSFGMGPVIREAATEEETTAEEDSDSDKDAEETTEEESPVLNINGGKININSNGDGLDSNMDLYINGGEVTVSGAVNGGNSAIDYGSESGGECVITEGTVIATGYSEMAEMFDEEKSTQNSFTYVFESDVSEETQIIITDSEGNEVCNYTTVKKCDCITFSSEVLKTGETYTVTAGSETGTIELTSMSVSNKELTGLGGGGFGGGGRPGDKNTESTNA